MKVPKNWIINGKEIEGEPEKICLFRRKPKKEWGKSSVFFQNLRFYRKLDISDETSGLPGRIIRVFYPENGLKFTDVKKLPFLSGVDAGEQMAGVFGDGDDWEPRAVWYGKRQGTRLSERPAPSFRVRRKSFSFEIKSSVL